MLHGNNISFCWNYSLWNGIWEKYLLSGACELFADFSSFKQPLMVQPFSQTLSTVLGKFYKHLEMLHLLRSSVLSLLSCIIASDVFWGGPRNVDSLIFFLQADTSLLWCAELDSKIQLLFFFRSSTSTLWPFDFLRRCMEFLVNFAPLFRAYFLRNQWANPVMSGVSQQLTFRAKTQNVGSSKRKFCFRNPFKESSHWRKT